MPTIQVRDVPPGLHKKLIAMAKAQGRSLNKQVLLLLQEALSSDDHMLRERRNVLLKQISAQRSPKIRTSPVDMIRQTRDER